MRRFSDLPIARKLTLIVMVTTTTALLVACAAFMSYELVRLRNDRLEDVTTLARILTQHAGAALAFVDRDAAEETLAALDTREHIIAAALYDRKGNLFVSYAPRGARVADVLTPAAAEEHRFDFASLTLSMPVLLEGERIGTVYLVSDLSAIRARVKRYAAIVAAVMLASSVVALLLSSGLQRLISAPLTHLLETARRVAVDRDYSARVVSRGRDEIGMLVDGFNAMLHQIRERDRALQAVNDTLEEKVRQRTRELEQEVAERRRAEGALRVSEEKYRSLIANIPDVTWTSDSRGVTTFISPNVTKVYGFTPEEIYADPEGLWLGRIHPEDLPRVTEAFHALFAQKRRFEVEYRVQRKDGTWIWLHDRTLGTYTKDGVEYCDGLFADVSQRKQAQIAMERARITAESANRAKSEFLANISHEIRTPMNGILGMTELLLDTELRTEQRENVELVRSSANSLLTLLNDILDFSKIEAGKFCIEPIDFDLRDSLDDTMRVLGPRARTKRLELACDVQADVPDPVVGDPGRLRQILVNLVGNAIKFTERGEIVVRVAVGSRSGHDVALQFSVSDTGIGIPADRQQAIFEAFTQVDGSTTRKYGGTGLGLAITRQIVEMMDGRIWVESEVGKGSVFHFLVRMGLQAVDADRPSDSPPVDLRGLRVLVVDDSAVNRRVLDETLQSWHMRPTAVEGGEAALEALKAPVKAGSAYRLLLLDACMPEMDGFDLARRIRRSARWADLPIIMLTSAGSPGDAARCRQPRFRGYLSKPVRRVDLLNAILAALGSAPKPGARPPLVTRHTLRAGRGGLRILVAEDNPVNQRVAVGLLEKGGHRVTVAPDGRRAMAALSKGRFDLVLMDLQMPEMGGLEVTAAIREKEKNSGAHLPIIAMTAYALGRDRERCLTAGMDGYLPKPIQSDRLFEAIDQALGARSSVGHRSPAPVPPKDTIDVEAILTRIGGDRALLTEIADLFLKTCPSLMQRIRQAIEESDGEALERAAHTLKGAVANFGVARVCEAARHLEVLGQEGDLSGAKNALADLDREVERLQPALARLAKENAA